MRRFSVFVTLVATILLFRIDGQVVQAQTSATGQASSRATAVAGQPTGGATSQATAKASAASQLSSSSAQQSGISAGTNINAALESAVDAKKAKPGDEVSAKVTKDVKQDGRVVVHKGDHLLGKVVSAQGSDTASAEGTSNLGVQFDRLQSGQTTTQLQTVVTGILHSSSSGGASSEEMSGMEAPESIVMPQGRAAASGGGGGLVGGVGSTVGGTLGATSGAVGNAGLGATADGALGTAGGGVTSTPARTIHVESQGSASQSAGMNSIFSSPKGNLHLDSGTALQFQVVGQANKPARSPSQ